MCGRYTLTEGSLRKQEKEFNDRFGIHKERPDHPKIRPWWKDIERPFNSSYNVAPTHIMPVFTNREEPKMEFFRWGIIPPWAKEFKMQVATINARTDQLLNSNLWRRLVGKGRHCLIPMDGYYEWRPVNPKTKEAFYFYMKDHEPFMCAGLYDIWYDAEKRENYTFTMITTEPNDTVSEIHDRMPAILSPEEYEIWLSKDLPAKGAINLLKTYPADVMKYHKVDSRVGSVKYNDEALILEDQTPNLF